MQAMEKGPNIHRSALLIVDMQNDFLHRDGNFSDIAREHPEAQIDLPFLIGTIPNVKRLADAFRATGRPVVYLAHVLSPTTRMRPFLIGVSESSLAAATARIVWRARGVRRSLMT
jgi:nicotinamidase-related amidase